MIHIGLTSLGMGVALRGVGVDMVLGPPHEALGLPFRDGIGVIGTPQGGANWVSVRASTQERGGKVAQ